MSEKRVCSASRSFAPLIGLFAAPNRPRNAPNSKIPLRKPLFQADSMRLWRIHSAKGAFTLSIDQIEHRDVGGGTKVNSDGSKVDRRRFKSGILHLG